MATSDMTAPTTKGDGAQAPVIPNVRLVLKDALAGLSFCEIAEAHGLDSGEQAEHLVLELLHRWVPATWGEAVAIERERLERLIRLADYLAARRSQSPAARSRSVRLCGQLRRMRDDLTVADRNQQWFADTQRSAIGAQPDYTPDFCTGMIEAIEGMDVSEADLAQLAAGLDALANTGPPDRHLTDGDAKRAAVMPQLEHLAAEATMLIRSFQAGGKLDLLAELLTVSRDRIDILDLGPRRRR